MAADTLTDAVVVADVFHLIRLGLQALDEVRRRRQQQIHGHRGHRDDPLFRLRRVLRVGQERLDETVVTKIFARLQDADTDDEVVAAWVAVDLLRRVYQAPDCDTAHRRLVTFYEWVVAVDVAEVSRLATTIDTLQDEVLAFSDTRASNTPTESTNVKIKSIRRAARGFRNCANYATGSGSTQASHVASRPPRGLALPLHHRGLTHLNGEGPRSSRVVSRRRIRRPQHPGPPTPRRQPTPTSLTGAP